MKFYSVHYHNSDMVKLQHKVMGKDLVVINNGRDVVITNWCKANGVLCYDVNCLDSNPSVSHGLALNQIKAVIDYNEDWGIIDHDTFITQPIVFGENEIIGIRQKAEGGYPYLNCGRIFGKKNVTINDVNFLPGFENPGDTASNTFKWIFKYNIGYISESYIGKITEGKLMQDSPVISSLHYNNQLIGYHGFNASNWTGTGNVHEKLEILKTTLGIEI